MKRIQKKFQELEAQNKCAFVAYICAGDPDYTTSLEILKNLPQAGCDIIELGVPFLDPAGDGPIIENASKRAIKNGASLKKTLLMVEDFRKTNDSTPLLLMGYYNPFLKYGLDKIFTDAQKAGVDGILIVDLPFEEKNEITKHLSTTNLDLINLIAPLTDEKRIKKLSDSASGFLYLVSMLGITGTKQANLDDNKINLQKIRNNSSLPVVIGFGISEPRQAEEFSKIGANGVVVGSAIVKEIDKNYSAHKNQQEIVENTLQKVREFAQAIKRC